MVAGELRMELRLTDSTPRRHFARAGLDRHGRRPVPAAARRAPDIGMTTGQLRRAEVSLDTQVATWHAARDWCVQHDCNTPSAASPRVAPIHHVPVCGRRLRSLLAYAACEAFAGDVDAVNDSALANKLVQAPSLLSDDLMRVDDAANRRGQPLIQRQCDEPLGPLADATMRSDTCAVVSRRTDLSTGACIVEPARACSASSIATKRASKPCAAGPSAPSAIPAE